MTDKEVKNRKVQFEFTDKAYQELIRLKDDTKANTLSDVERSALRLYRWYVEQIKAGYHIALVKNGKLEKEVELIF